MAKCTPHKKSEILKLSQQGQTDTEIASKLHIHYSTVHRNLQKMREDPDFISKPPGSGRPPKLGLRDLRRADCVITSAFVCNATDFKWKLFPQVSVRTMHQVLSKRGLHGRVRHRKPLLTQNH